MALKTHVKRLRDAIKQIDQIDQIDRTTLEIEHIRDAIKQVQRTTRELLAEPAGALIPEGYALIWEQYTPSYNDGDACVLTLSRPRLASLVISASAGEPSRKRDLNDSDDLQETNDPNCDTLQDTSADSFPELTSAVLGRLRELWAVLNVDDQFLKQTFGSNVRVVVHSNGEITCHDYDCGH